MLQIVSHIRIVQRADVKVQFFITVRRFTYRYITGVPSLLSRTPVYVLCVQIRVSNLFTRTAILLHIYDTLALIIWLYKQGLHASQITVYIVCKIGKGTYTINRQLDGRIRGRRKCLHFPYVYNARL